MKRFIGQPQFLKEVNINIINNIIIEKGPITKPEISKISGLSLPTVNKIVATLEEENLVKTAGMEGSGVGRKAQLYVTNEDSGSVLTLYFMNDVYICCINNMIGDVIYRFTVSIDTVSSETALQDTYGAIKRLLENTKNNVIAIGIGVPGIVKNDGRLSSIPSIPEWEGINLQMLVEEKFDIPTFVENDVKLTTIGYYANNLKNKCESMAYIYMGKGVGSGIILDKKIYKGFNGFAGEFGFMTTGVEGTIHGSSGCCETALTEMINYVNSENAEKEKVLDLKKRMADTIAKVITNFVCVVNPQTVVLKGGIVSTEFINAIGNKLKKLLPTENIPQILEDRSDMSGINGLVSLCTTNSSSNYNIVREKGV